MKKIMSLVLLLMVSCSTSTVLIKKTNEEMSKMSLSVTDFVEPSEINYVGDVENEFGKGEKEILIKEFLIKEIIQKIKAKSSFNNVDTNKAEIAMEREEEIYKSKGQSSNPTPIIREEEKQKIKTDVLLVLYDLSVNTQTNIKTVSYVPYSITRKLLVSFKYYYYLKTTNEILSSGEIRENDDSDNLKPFIGKNNWEKIIAEIIDKLLINESYVRKEAL